MRRRILVPAVLAISLILLVMLAACSPTDTLQTTYFRRVDDLHDGVRSEGFAGRFQRRRPDSRPGGRVRESLGGGQV